MDLFKEYLNKADSSKVIRRALTDNSYKNEYSRVNHRQYDGDVNTDLATYGDAVIRLCYCEILLDKTNELTKEKANYESDKYLVEEVARHYDLLKYIKKDTKDINLAVDYDYDSYESGNGNRAKYIATAVEAMIGAIYKETNDIEPIAELLKCWMDFKGN